MLNLSDGLSLKYLFPRMCCETPFSFIEDLVPLYDLARYSTSYLILLISEGSTIGYVSIATYASKPCSINILKRIDEVF